MSNPSEQTSQTMPAQAISAQLFHLALDTVMQPVEPADWPDRVSDLPAFYYWKDAIVVGQYVHPAGRFSLDITRDRLDGYVTNFARMKENGVGVPILMDHTAAASATLGWIVDVRRDGDRLLELHQFLGEEARDVGLRNKVSLGIDPHFVDGRGVDYGEAIVHSAVTPTPVVPGQGEYVKCGMGVPPMRNPEVELIELKLKAPERKELPAEAASPVGNTSVGSLDLSVALNALEQVAIAKRDLALSRGAITPAVANEIFDLLAKPANLLMLSRTSAGLPLALAVFDALAKNVPVPLGEMTGVQVLSRTVPGEEGDELRERMIAMASGK
jgi:hypothetical protein